MVDDFGRALRAIRQQRGWRQQDLVDAMNGTFARSTVANVETGRERPSARMWDEIRRLLPEHEEELGRLYEQSRIRIPRVLLDGERSDDGRGLLGGPFLIEVVRYVYVFRESKAPEEVIEVRRIRATRNGAAGFGLKFTNTRSADFHSEAEALWGGAITSHERLTGSRRTVYLRRFTFPRPLSRGETHDFALRTWIERDPEPSSEVIFDLTVPATLVNIQLNFAGQTRPRSVYQIGPVPDDVVRPANQPRTLVAPIAGSVWAADFSKPSLGYHYGLEWVW